MKKLSLLAVVVVVLFGLGASPAFAVNTPYRGLAPVFQQGADGQPVHQQRIAVNRGTGRLYVTDVIGDRIRVFDPTVSGATVAAAFGVGEVIDPLGVAVDQETGAIYVSDADDVVKYASDGTLDPTFTSPGVTGPVAFDQNADELLVADTATNVVRRYSPAGTPGATFDGSDGATAFTGLQDLAVAPSGDVYIVDADGDPAFPGVSTHVERYSAAGQHQASVGAGADAATIAVNATGDRVLVSADQAAVFVDGTATLSVFDTADLSAPVEQINVSNLFFYHTIRGLAIDDGPLARLYVGTDNGRYPCDCYGTTSLLVYERLAAPTLTIAAATNVTGTSVDLTGTVNPNGADTTYHFELSTDNGASWNRDPDANAGAGESALSVQTTLSGLQPATGYLARLVASNAGGSAESSSVSFATSTTEPTASTGTVGERGTTYAALRGSVSPHGLLTTYHFEYGTSTDYGSRAPAGDEAQAGKGNGVRLVAHIVSGLRPSTTYHYRVVATNSLGTSLGDDRTFTTDDAPPPARVYEMVSPLDNGGVSVDAFPAGVKARDDGKAVAYTLAKATYPGAPATPYQPKVLSVRQDDGSGWSALSLDAPTSNLGRISVAIIKTVVATSEDLRRSLVITTRKLGEQGVEGNGNLYVFDVDTQQYRLVATSSEPDFFEPLTKVNAPVQYIGGDRDLDTIAFLTTVSLTPDASGPMKTYVWSAAAGLRFIAPSNHETIDSRQTNPNQVSQDGRRVYVENGSTPSLYEGGQLKPISIDQRTGQPPTPREGRFAGASPDGRYALLVSEARLTDDAMAAVGSGFLYRYDAETGHLEFLSVGPIGSFGRVLNGLPGSVDGGVYMTAFDRLAGATGEPLFLYHVGDGGVQFIAATDEGNDFDAFTSPNGRYLAFVVGGRHTSYDNRGVAEVYLYDAQTEELTCPSCRTDGGSPTGGNAGIAQQGGGGSEWQRYHAQAVTDDGQVFFDTPDPLVERDTNGVRDVYSYQSGRVALISRGVGPAATFMDATRSGSDVFFVTEDRVVGQDDNAVADLYDARIGGGIAAQSRRDRRAVCGGSECREPDVGSSGPRSVASEGVDAVSSKPGVRARARVSVVRSSFGLRALRLTVRVSSGGRIRVSGVGLSSVVRSVSRAGRYTLVVPLTEKARRARRARRRVKVVARVALTPPFAALAVTKLTRTLGR